MKGLLGSGTALSLQRAGGQRGHTVREGIFLRSAEKLCALQDLQQLRVAEMAQIFRQDAGGGQMPQRLQQSGLGAVFIAGHIERQHRQQPACRAMVMGRLDIAGDQRKQLLPQQLEVALPVSAGNALLQLPKQLLELLGPLAGQGIHHIGDGAEHPPFQVLCGGIIAEPAQELQDLILQQV